MNHAGLTSWKLASLALLVIAVAGCRSSGGKARVDDAFSSFMDRGAKAYAVRQWTSAYAQYELALERAWATGSALDAADAAYNLALLHAQQGDYDAADVYLNLAMASARRVRESIPWDMQLLQAKLLYAKGETERARQTALAALPAAGRSGETAAHEVQLALARMELASGDADQAEARLNQAAREGLERGQEPAAAELRALLSEEAGQFKKAAQHYAEAATLARSAEDYEHLADWLAASARCWRQAGQSDLAGDYFIQAATAWYGRRNWPEALKCVQAALDAVGDTDAGSVRGQARDLVTLIERQTNKTEVNQ